MACGVSGLSLVFFKHSASANGDLSYGSLLDGFLEYPLFNLPLMASTTNPMMVGSNWDICSLPYGSLLVGFLEYILLHFASAFNGAFIL